MTPRALLVVLGEPPSSVRAVVGDYAAWFRRAWGAPLDVAVAGAAPLPEPASIPAVLLSGSPRSVNEVPWIAEAEALVRRAVAAGVPLLGVCFGHQLIARALGGAVARNPAGWEFGTCEVELTDAGAGDPLFAGGPRRFAVNQAHGEHVAALPPGAVVLARSPLTAVQAFAVGDHVRGVQFHPEMNGAVIAAELAARPDLGILPTVDCPEAEAVLGNFRARFARLV